MLTDPFLPPHSRESHGGWHEGRVRMFDRTCCATGGGEEGGGMLWFVGSCVPRR